MNSCWGLLRGAGARDAPAKRQDVFDDQLPEERPLRDQRRLLKRGTIVIATRVDEVGRDDRVLSAVVERLAADRGPTQAESLPACDPAITVEVSPCLEAWIEVNRASRELQEAVRSAGADLEKSSQGCPRHAEEANAVLKGHDGVHVLPQHIAGVPLGA